MTIDAQPQEPNPANLPETEQGADSGQPSPVEILQRKIAEGEARISGEPANTHPEAEPESAAPSQQEETPPPARKIKFKADGKEVELPEDEVVSLASKGMDYTKKTQALADQALELKAWEQHITRVKTDPAYAQHVFGYDTKLQAAQGTPPVQADPLAQFEAELEQRILGKISPALAPVQQIQAEQAVMGFMGKLQAVEGEAFQPTFEAMKQYVNALPPTLRDATLMRFEQGGPPAFLEVYEHVKSINQSSAPAAPSQPKQPTGAKPATVMQRQAPPALESAGAAQAQAVDRTKSDKAKSQLAQKIKSAQASPQDINEYLRLSGAFQRMSGTGGR